MYKLTDFIDIRYVSVTDSDLAEIIAILEKRLDNEMKTSPSPHLKFNKMFLCPTMYK